MAEEETVAVLDGPNGQAKIVEIWSDGRLVEYKVDFNGKIETSVNVGEAYILAGEKVGVKT